MKFTALTALMTLSALNHSQAASGVFESFGILKINASTSYYDMQAATGLPDFQGASLGTFDDSLGNTLTLVGGELKTFKNGLSDVFSPAKFDYRIFKTGDTPGDFSEFDLYFNSNLGGGDQKWDNSGANVDVLSGLTNGNYTLEVFAYANTSDGTAYSNNSGNNFKASFTVVPEPTSVALGLIGSIALLRRRRI